MNKVSSENIKDKEPTQEVKQDDGTRMIKISGCHYKLLESEILDWLGLFGEVLSEITEELYQDKDDPQSVNLPPVGNGNYRIRMKLRRDIPNWLPMYGRRVQIEYKGIKRQCNSCYGPHLRKYNNDFNIIA